MSLCEHPGCTSVSSRRLSKARCSGCLTRERRMTRGAAPSDGGFARLLARRGHGPSRVRAAGAAEVGGAAGDPIPGWIRPQFWWQVCQRLLLAAGKATGLPVLYNTSFNLFGDPLVCTPRDAVRSFYSSGIDTLFARKIVLATGQEGMGDWIIPEPLRHLPSGRLPRHPLSRR